MQVVILCGGLGMRLRELTETKPKPMVPIGSYPIIWHIMKIYSYYGHHDFILCLGYKKESFIDYFMNYRNRNSDITLSLRDNNIQFHNNHLEQDWKVTLADTGLTTDTGGRVKRIEKYIKGDDFFLTYGDGVANVNVNDVLKFHRANDKIITVTAVRPSSRFGELHIRQNMVRNFSEKPQTSKGYINGGFMVVNRRIFKGYMNDDPDLDFESQVMPELAADGEMAAYQHKGFWQCMDTSREYNLLNRMWKKDKAFWKCW